MISRTISSYQFILETLLKRVWIQERRKKTRIWQCCIFQLRIWRVRPRALWWHTGVMYWGTVQDWCRWTKIASSHGLYENYHHAVKMFYESPVCHILGTIPPHFVISLSPTRCRFQIFGQTVVDRRILSCLASHPCPLDMRYLHRTATPNVAMCFLGTRLLKMTVARK